MIDVISAFDTVVRGLVYNNSYFDDRVAHILKHMNLGPDVMHDIAKHISHQSSLSAAGVSSHVASVVREIHSDAWHSTQGMPNITTTNLGSKPGDPLGDIIFHFLATRVLGSWRREHVNKKSYSICLLLIVVCLVLVVVVMLRCLIVLS